jgi:S-adenosylmethionine:tRNA ribosyltransferase-isomerase
MEEQYRRTAYDYHLPEELIAQQPVVRRSQSRLLTLDCNGDTLNHGRFEEITALFRPGDLLVINNTRVFPARLFGRKPTGGKVEMLLLHFPEPVNTTGPVHQSAVVVLLKSSKRPKPGSMIELSYNLKARVESLRPDGKVEVTLFHRAEISLEAVLDKIGQIPLPPYIKRPEGSTAEDTRRYQTRYALHTGSVAAPTAGLHFSDTLMARLQDMGIRQVPVTLHVGYGTFAPVRSRDIRRHRIHEEYVSIPTDTARVVNQTRESGGRIWAVGTTTARTLEYGTDNQGRVQAAEGFCGLYIYPGYQFQVVDNLITNFHLPQSSLLFLVSALAGRRRIMAAYREAVLNNYRFFSYGDAMAILTRA